MLRRTAGESNLSGAGDKELGGEFGGKKINMTRAQVNIWRANGSMAVAAWTKTDGLESKGLTGQDVYVIRNADGFGGR